MVSMTPNHRTCSPEHRLRVRRQARLLMWSARWSWRPYAAHYRHMLDRAAMRNPRAAVDGLWVAA